MSGKTKGNISFKAAVIAVMIAAFGVSANARVTESESSRCFMPDTSRMAKPSLLQRIGHTIGSIINEFNIVDTAYVEPQHYKFQCMLQSTSTFDQYTFTNDEGNSITLAPDMHTMVGPYVGYSLIFLGYNIQLNNLYVGDTRKRFDLSLYSSMVGVDFFYNSSNDIKIRQVYAPTSPTLSVLQNQEFDGINVSSKGFNAYYILNHRRHSYPAAYNQSTCQKMSAGSPIAGIGYSKHSIKFDWERLNELASQIKTADQTNTEGKNISNVNYSCYSAYGGYSYNWVFARNWLAGVSLTAALAYNHTTSDNSLSDKFIDTFSISNLCIDGVGRMGLVWNNNRIFAGTSVVVHSYRYAKDQFSAQNIFGNVKVYAGFNLGKKKAYRSKDKFFEF